MTTEPAGDQGARPVSRRTGRLVLGAVLGVAALEWIASAVVYRPAIEPGDWQAASAAIDDLPPDQPVWLGTPWLGPRARLHLPPMARWEAVAPPDLRGAPRFHVLGLAGDAWSSVLEADLEDLPAPTLTNTTPLGGLTLYTYEQPAAGVRLADFVADAARLEVQTEGGTCRGRRGRTCDEGRVDPAVAEVGYRPRRCLKVDLEDGVAVALRYPGMPTGDVLRGHVGVDDFNARLRSDSPVRVRVRIDDELRAQWLVTDAQGWWPFALVTEPGTHDVELELTPAVQGTWQKSGYTPGRGHGACVELRSLQEGPS